MERSEIREGPRAFDDVPGLRFAPSGLPLATAGTLLAISSPPCWQPQNFNLIK
jgi:hypothetical protein